MSPNILNIKFKKIIRFEILNRSIFPTSQIFNKNVENINNYKKIKALQLAKIRRAAQIYKNG